MTSGAELQELSDCPAGACEPETTGNRRTFVPRADVYETASDIIVHADLPGVEEKDVDITIEKNILTIKAVIEQQAPAGQNLAYAEYAVGDFLRKFALTNEINREGISATLKDGVLRLVLPKCTTSQVRKISVSG